MTIDRPLCEADQTIFALATPPGRAGVAILRISGAAAFDILPYLGVTRDCAPRTASLVRLKHPQTGELIDQAIALPYPSPNSFTGENVLELQTHGSRAILDELVTILANHPACRLAEPGEFSRRAFTHGKMDLIEAEGLADLIDAETTAQQRQALRQMDGELGAQYESFRADIVHALALMEAYIDFPDEDIPESVTKEVNDSLQSVRATMLAALADDGVGEKIRDGLSVVILGAPNAGKSSLLNALAKRDVAIVSDIAGTTRDAIEVELNLDGYRVTLTDTAGLRETAEQIEAEGIRRAEQKAQQADIKMVLIDSVAYPKQSDQSLALIDNQTIVLLNKWDQLIEADRPSLLQSLQGKWEVEPLPLSVKNGEGMEVLIERLKEKVASRMTASQSPIITRTRHRVALQLAVEHLDAFLLGGPIELMTEELRCAAQQLAKITGQITVDELLDIVFSRFCIGK